MNNELSTILSPKQICSLQQSTTRVTVWEGSIRSGKTFISLFRWLIFVASAPTGGELVMVARTREAAARNLFALLQNAAYFGAVADQVKYTSGAPTANILGRTVHVIGASDAKSEKVLRGMTVAGAYVDEATVIPEEFFTQLLGRMSVSGAQLFCTTNPDNPSHWFKKRYLDRISESGVSTPDKPLTNWTRFHFVMQDNPALDEEFIESTSREYTGLWHRRFILGEWVAGDGAIFSMWEPSKHVIRWEDLPKMDRLISVGIDFGTTNATSAVMLGLHYEVNEFGYRTGAAKLYAVDEWRYAPQDNNNMRLTNADLSVEIRTWLDFTPHLPYPTALAPTYLCVDPAAASFKVQLSMDGVKNLVNADNQVNYGVGVMATLLGKNQLTISDRCKGLLEEIPAYSWEPRASSLGEDKPLKIADHSIDALRYALITTEKLWRPEL